LLTVCLLGYVAAGRQPTGTPSWYSIVPPLLAVTLALITNRLFLSLGAAVLAGGLLGAAGNPAGLPARLFQGAHQATILVSGTVYDSDSHAWDMTNVQILLFVVFLMSMISVMIAGGGLQGVANWLTKYAGSVRSTKLVTIVMGLVIFLDDYANTMIVGSTLRPVTDRQRISREKLAFLVDATAAPVAGIAVISTWIGYEVGLLSDMAESLRLAKDGYAMFFDALAFRFYCIGMIAFVFFNALTGEDFGPMAKAEKRAAKHGKLLDDGAVPMTSRSLAAAEPHPAARIHALVAVVPIAGLLLVFVGRLWFDAGGAFTLSCDPLAVFRFSVWKQAFSTVDSIPLLAYASAFALLLAAAIVPLVARIPPGALARAIATGARSSLLPVTVLLLAWSLKRACDHLGTGGFLADTLGDSLPPLVFPALVFVVAGLTSFATGTSFGTMAILIPTAIPVAFQLDGEIYGHITVVTVAAILDGAIFGDHCSPISDTTIMSSTASSCDHLAHVRTQIPYSLVVAAIALCPGYLVAAAGASKWVGIGGGIALLGLLFVGLRILRLRARSAQAQSAVVRQRG